jgi:hypothetical protein
MMDTKSDNNNGLNNIDMNLMGVDKEEPARGIFSQTSHQARVYHRPFAQTSHQARVYHRAMGGPPKRGEHCTDRHELVTPTTVAPGLSACGLMHEERGHSHVHNSFHMPIVPTKNYAQLLAQNSAQPQANLVPPPVRNENIIPTQQLPSNQNLLSMAIINRQIELNLISVIAYEEMCATINRQKMADKEMCATINHQRRLTLKDPPETKYQEVIAEIQSEVVEIRSDCLRVSNDNAILNQQMSEMKNQESLLVKEMDKIKNDRASERAILIAAHNDNMQKMKTEWEFDVRSLKEELDNTLRTKSELEDSLSLHHTANSKMNETCKKLTEDLNNTVRAKSDLEAMLHQNRTDHLRVSNDNAIFNQQMSEMKNQESWLIREMDKIKNDCASERAILIAAHNDNMQKMKTEWEFDIRSLKVELTATATCSHC